MTNNYIKVFRVRKFISDADLTDEAPGASSDPGTARTLQMAVESYFFFDDRDHHSARNAEIAARTMAKLYESKGWEAGVCGWAPYVNMSGIGGFPTIGEFPEAPAGEDL